MSQSRPETDRVMKEAHDEVEKAVATREEAQSAIDKFREVFEVLSSMELDLAKLVWPETKAQKRARRTDP